MPTKAFSLAAISEDKPLFVLETRSNQRIRLFTDQGAVLSLAVEELPETRATTRAANLRITSYNVCYTKLLRRVHYTSAFALSSGP